jgi:FG-GAP-like repeat
MIMTSRPTRPAGLSSVCPVTRRVRLAALSACAAALSSVSVAQDINGNAVRDAVDLKNGTSLDCNHNGVPDEVDLLRPSFSAAIEHSNDAATLTNVTSSAALDYDLDGDLDLVVAARSGQNNSTLTIWRNDGGPALVFGTRVTVLNALCLSVRAGDLNADGRMDVVASDSGFANVVVMLASGAGSFAAPVKLSASSRAVGLALADLDGDGDLDIASPGFASNGVDVFRNNGSGTFAPRVTYACGQQPIAVAAGDFDGDGQIDLAVANSFISAPGVGTVSLLRNVGGASFVTHATITVPGHASTSLNSRPHDVALQDIDGDGDRDLLVSSKNSNSLQIFTNSGTGTFANTQTLGPLPVIASSADRFTCRNLDADAALELAWCDPSARVVHLYDNDAGTLSLRRSFAAGSEGPIFVEAADLNGDEIVDLVTSNDSSSAFSTMVGLGELSFDAVEHIRRADSNFYPMLADFTGDGITDLASYATSDTPTTFRIAPGLGSGEFGPAIVISLPSPAPLFPRDANGDGHLDIVGVGNGGNRYCMLNNGDGSFGSAIFSDPISVGPNFQSADINGDGHLDVLWTWTTISSAPHHVRISLGDGSGFFAPYYEFTTPPFLGALWTGDLTGDGFPELFASVGAGVVGPLGYETVLVYPNNGDGTFGPYEVHAYDLFPNFAGGVGNFAWVDIDGDGDRDLLGASGYTFLYRNVDGALAPPVAVGGFANYSRNEFGPTIADADGDGDLDLYGSATVSGVTSPAIFFNDGTGGFGPRSALMRYRNSPDAIAFGDADNNGRPDILVKPDGYSDWYLHTVEPTDVPDCNGNQIADACDIASGSATDENGDGIPDECQAPAVNGDLDGDGLVSGSDLAILLGAWGSTNSAADLNGNGFVDAADLGILLGAWTGG